MPRLRETISVLRTALPPTPRRSIYELPAFGDRAILTHGRLRFAAATHLVTLPPSDYLPRSSCRCSTIRNFSLLLGDCEGNGSIGNS